MADNPDKADAEFAVDSEEDVELMMRSVPAAYKAAQDIRKVEVHVQRWRPQRLRLVVAVPISWTDEDVKSRLGEIYEEADPADDNWCDQDDCGPKEGTHELTGELDPSTRPWITYPPKDE